jgi:hypothetical protein
MLGLNPGHFNEWLDVHMTEGAKFSIPASGYEWNRELMQTTM